MQMSHLMQAPTLNSQLRKPQLLRNSKLQRRRQWLLTIRTAQRFVPLVQPRSMREILATAPILIVMVTA